jgi:glycosyltransferase involved in cell wall biosynthesis
MILTDPIQILNILFWIFNTSVAIQLFYYWAIFSRFAFYKPKQKGFTPEPAISVVICAKNEYHNLKENLPAILNQDYPDFEVVVVNDASDDETIFLLEDLDREYERLSVVNISQNLNFFKGKKFALSLGIKSAKHEHLLLTDADCMPSSNNWIKEMTAGFSNQKQVVLGYGGYATENTLINFIIRFETVFTAIQYFSLALAGIPYMGVGRNLAYRKSLFIKNNGFISHYKVASGDDDLFIKEVATKKNTSIVVDKGSFTTSPAKKSFRNWWIQKRRHLSTGKYYKTKHKIILSLQSLSLIILFISFVILLVAKFNWWIVLILFFIRFFTQLVVFKKSFSRLNEKKLLLLSPIIEVILLILYPLLVLSNLIAKQDTWK